jgi:prophage maintenance system killer protein
VRNGYLFVCEDAVLVLQVERLAAGLVDQERMAEWIRARLQEG